MTARMIYRTVVFARSFTLSGIDGVQPPGSYSVETEEELIEGVSFPVYRRIETVILLPGPPGSSILSQTVIVDPEELAEAERRDALP